MGKMPHDGHMPIKFHPYMGVDYNAVFVWGMILSTYCDS